MRFSSSTYDKLDYNHFTQNSWILLSHCTCYREIIVIEKKTEFEILVEISILGSPELKKEFFYKISICMSD